MGCDHDKRANLEVGGGVAYALFTFQKLDFGLASCIPHPRSYSFT